MIRAKDAKGMIALAWLAKLSMAFAVQLQAKLAQIPASRVLKPRRDGGCPLSEAEVHWQLELYDSDVEPGNDGR